MAGLITETWRGGGGPGSGSEGLPPEATGGGPPPGVDPRPELCGLGGICLLKFGLKSTFGTTSPPRERVAKRAALPPLLLVLLLLLLLLLLMLLLLALTFP